MSSLGMGECQRRKQPQPCRVEGERMKQQPLRTTMGSQLQLLGLPRMGKVSPYTPCRTTTLLSHDLG